MGCGAACPFAGAGPGRGGAGKPRRVRCPTPPSPFPSWWGEYSDRKNDEGEEHVADSLLYDRNHLPRSAPAPDCVPRAPVAGGGGGGTGGPATPPLDGGQG